MSFLNSDREWERLGQDDPYYGVLSQDRFREGRLNEEVLRDFFKSGVDHIDTMYSLIKQHVDPSFAPKRCLDFGCGVGRCLVPMAQRTESAIGVDVSESMIEEAKRVCERNQVSNTQLVMSDDALARVTGELDFIHAVLVFQHIPPQRGLKLFSALVSRLADHGVIAIQLPYYRDVPTAVKVMGALRKHVPLFHNLVNLLYRKPFGDPLMEKNCYPLKTLFHILQTQRCANLHVEFQGRGKFLSVILMAQKRSEWVAY